MNHLLNRVKVYSHYFYEYVRYAEFSSALNAVLYMLTHKSYSGEKQIKTSMGVFETRGGTLDFQYINYAYEIGLKNFIEKQQFHVFFDVGACLGEYCIWLGHRGYRCFAFEPVEDSFSMIRKNIVLNNVHDRVTAYNYGLGRRHSIEHFQIHPVNPGASKRVAEPNHRTRKFEINALDDVYESFGLKTDNKILMKIDVEGMEAEMLLGAARFLRHFDDITLIIEDTITGNSKIVNILNSICEFEYGKVDHLNMYAKKKKYP